MSEIKNCATCRRLLDNSADTYSADCGGDCRGCMLVIEQPEKYTLHPCLFCGCDCVIPVWQLDFVDRYQTGKICIERDDFSQHILNEKVATNHPDIQRLRASAEAYEADPSSAIDITNLRGDELIKALVGTSERNKRKTGFIKRFLGRNP